MTSSQAQAPAPVYTVGDLIDHVDQVSRGATALARHAAGLPGTGPDAAHLDPHWRYGAAQHVRELGEVWDDPAARQGSANVPGPDLSSEMWGKITLTELVVHGWDIAQATGQPFDLPEHTLQACLDHVAKFQRPESGRRVRVAHGPDQQRLISEQDRERLPASPA